MEALDLNDVEIKQYLSEVLGSILKFQMHYFGINGFNS